MYALRLADACIPNCSTTLDIVPMGSIFVSSGRLMWRFSTAGRSYTREDNLTIILFYV